MEGSDAIAAKRLRGDYCGHCGRDLPFILSWQLSCNKAKNSCSFLVLSSSPQSADGNCSLFWCTVLGTSPSKKKLNPFNWSRFSKAAPFHRWWSVVIWFPIVASAGYINWRWLFITITFECFDIKGNQKMAVTGYVWIINVTLTASP